MGMNPGMISICVKKALEDAAKFFLSEGKLVENHEQLKKHLIA
jgi:homospermidine synthase